MEASKKTMNCIVNKFLKFIIFNNLEIITSTSSALELIYSAEAGAWLDFVDKKNWWSVLVMI